MSTRSSSPHRAPLSERARTAARLGVYGGSFDPVHRAHAWVARTAQQRFELDHVVWIPAARPPHKPGVELAAGEHRLAMVELAIAGEPTWSAWSYELEHDGPSYTVETLRELARLRTGSVSSAAPLFLVIGADNLAAFPRWRAVDEIVRLAQPIVVARSNDARLELERLRVSMSAADFARLCAGFIDVAPLDVSATDVRTRLRASGDAATDLAESVASYIRERDLYRSRTAE